MWFDYIDRYNRNFFFEKKITSHIHQHSALMIHPSIH